MAVNYRHWTSTLSGKNETEQDAIELLLGYLLAENPSLLHTLKGWISEGGSGPISRAGQCIKRIVAQAGKVTT